MQFLYPSFLWALLALAIPIIIHLFYFRRFKKVYFTNVKFLKEVKEETSSRNKLKNLLILLSRLLALAALVFAFARPFIPTSDSVKTGYNAVSVFVDNSFSMNATKEGTPLFVLAKSKAQDIINAYTQEDQFQVLTHDFEGRHQRLLSKEDALSFVEELTISPEVKSMSQILNRQKQVVDKSDLNKIAYILSDFQSSIVDESIAQDSSLEVNLIPIQSLQEANVSIDSVWFEALVPMLNQNNNVLIKVTNHSENAIENVKLSILKDGEEKPISVRNIDAKTTVIDSISLPLFKTGVHNAVVKVTDYPVQFDDVYNISFEVAEEIKVLAINENKANNYLTALFNGMSYFNIDNVANSQVNYQKFIDYQLIILNDVVSFSSGMTSELKQYVENGGKVLLFPAKNGNLETYNQFLNTLRANTFIASEKRSKEVNGINTDEFIFNDVFEKINQNVKLPKTNFDYTRTAFQNKIEEKILSYKDGSPYLVKNIFEKGILYICSAPLDENDNDLVLNAEIFVPMLYKMALSRVQAEKIAYQIGKDQIIEVDGNSSASEKIYKITGKEEFIPGQSQLGKKVLLDVKNQIEEAGVYKINLDDKVIKTLAFNYDRQESNLEMIKGEDLQKYFQGYKTNIFDQVETANFKESILEKDQGISLWKWCLILALIFLGIESLLLRFWKNS